MLWAVVVLCAIAYAAYLYFGSVATAEAEAERRTVEVFELIDHERDAHRLSGVLTVPSACHSISWETIQVEEKRYHIAFTTFGDIHGCAKGPQARAFRTVIVAPAPGSTVTASLDNEPLVLRIVRTNYAEGRVE